MLKTVTRGLRYQNPDICNQNTGTKVTSCAGVTLSGVLHCKYEVLFTVTVFKLPPFHPELRMLLLLISSTSVGFLFFSPLSFLYLCIDL